MSSSSTDMGSVPSKNALSLSMNEGASPRMSLRDISMWSHPVAASIVLSSVWENGGWHTSCSIAAARSMSDSSLGRPSASAMRPER